MKTIIAGSRSITNYRFVVERIEASEIHITEVISGGADGVDKLGELYAKNNRISIKPFYVGREMRKKYGKFAYLRRNELMARYAAMHGGALILVWDGGSTGSLDMYRRAKDHDLPFHVFGPADRVANIDEIAGLR